MTVPDSTRAHAARSVSQWMTGRGEGVDMGVLRERQWLVPSGGGEIIDTPPCFRYDELLGWPA